MDDGQPIDERQVIVLYEPQQVELQVGSNENKQKYNYDEPPTDGIHEWVNCDERLPPGYDDVAPKDGTGCVKGCKETPHRCAWFLTILVLVPFLSFFICLPLLSSDYCALGAGFWGLVAGAYVFYLVEVVCCSSSMHFLENTMEGETVYEWVAKIKQNPPTIQWKIECFHYETKESMSTDESEHQQKVVTHTASMEYSFGSWEDKSKDVTGLDQYNLTQFKAFKQFRFADSATESDYKMKSAQFRRDNDRDMYQSFYYQVEIPDFQHMMLFEVKQESKSSTVSVWAYMVSSLLLCTTCYRMYLSAICGRKNFLFEKQIKMVPIQQTVVVAQEEQNSAVPKSVVSQ